MKAGGEKGCNEDVSGSIDVRALKHSLKLGMFEMQGEAGGDERGVEQSESAKLGAGTQVEGVRELDGDHGCVRF